MPNRPFRWTIALLALFTSQFACQLLPSSKPQDGVHDQLLFQDNFSDVDSGWKRIATPQGSTDYDDGVYRILVNEPGLDIWSMPGRSFGDVRIEVDALKVGGERDNRFGLICRAISEDSFYTFIVSSDGYYGIGKIQGQGYSLIGMDSLQPSKAILKGSALNHLRADCIGNRLTLFVNGTELISVQDDSYPAGDIGLIAGTYETSGTDIRFDNLSVFRP